MTDRKSPASPKHPSPSLLRSLFRTRKKRPGIFVWAVFLFGLYGLGLGVALPYFAKPYLERELAVALNGACSIRQLTIDPFTLRIIAHDIVIPYPHIPGHETNEEFLRLKRLELSPSPDSLTAKAVVFNDVRFVAPRFHLARFKDGSLSPQLFFSADATCSLPTEEGIDNAGLFPLVVRNITVQDGELSFADAIHGTSYTVSDIDLSVPLISTRSSDSDIALTPTLSALVNGKQITLNGETRPFAPTMQTIFILGTRSMDLPAFRSYIEPYTNLTLESGSLQTELTLRFALDAEKAFDIALAGDIFIENLKLADGKNLVLSLPKASAEVENILLGPRRVSIKNLDLENPEVVLRRNKQGAVDLPSFFFLPEGMPASDMALGPSQGAALPLSERPDKEKQPSGTEGLPILMTVEKAHVNGGKVTWHDAVPSPPVRYTLENVDATFSDVSTAAMGRADFTFGFRNGKTEFSAEGRATASPMRVEGRISLENMPITPFKPYIADSGDLNIKGGAVSASGNLVLQYAPTPAARLTEGSLTLSGISARLTAHEEREKPLAALSHIKADKITADLAGRTLAIGEISGAGIDVALVRDKNGEILLPTIVSKPSGQAAGPGSLWKIDVNAVRVGASNFSFTDLSLRRQPALPLTNISVTGRGFANHGNKRWTCTVTATPGTRGSLSLTASGVLAPLDLTFSATMDKADMRPLRPYIRDTSRIILTEATLGGDVEGRIRRVPGSARGGELSVKGNLGLYGITLEHKRKELGGWGRMRIEDMEFRAPASGGRHLRLGSVRVNTPRLAVNIDEAGVSSLSAAFQSADKSAPDAETTRQTAPGEAAETGESEFPLTSLDIGNISISLGQANWLDQRVSPPYVLRVDKVNIELAGLSLDPQKDATLEGNLSINGSPVAVSGTFRSLLTSPSGNGKLDIWELDLARFTQYAEKYLGYPVRRGTLNMHAEASLKGRKLSMQNSVRISNLDLGKKTASAHAPNMPLPAAVSLIRGPGGDILLELPVSGTIGDPEFKLGGMVGAVISNLILKTVTSPFSILGSVMGGFIDLFSDKGRTNAEIVFAIGEDTLDAEAKSVLEELGDQLHKHPRALLEITGTADRGEESVLVDAWVAKALRQRKYNSLPAAEREKTSPEAMLVGPEHNAREYSRLLFALYGNLPFVKKSKDPEIISPQSTRAVMRILRSRMDITDDQLRVLARTRALAVYHALARGKIDIAARLRIQDPQIYDAGETGGRLSSYARIQVIR